MQPQRDVAARNPQLLGLGIDEDTALVVHDDQCEVLGAGKVVLFNERPASGNRILVFHKGDRFALASR